MSHDSLSSFEPRHASPRGFQFSLLGLFLLMTAAAMVVGGIVALAAALGLEPTSAVLQAVGQQITNLPTLVVWLVAVVMLVNRTPQNSRASKYGICGFGGLLLLSLLGMGFHIFIFAAVNSNSGWSMSALTWFFPIYGFIHSSLAAACYGFLLAAILAGRSGDAAGADRSPELRLSADDA